MKTKPKIEIDLKLVEQYGAQGMSQEQIARALGISPRTLYNRKKESAEFAEAFKKGQAMGEAVVTNKLMQLIKAGHFPAIAFYLKCKAGWKETNAFEMTSPDGSMTPKGINVDFSGMTPEELTEIARAAFTGK